MPALRKDTLSIPGEFDPFSALFALIKWSDLEITFKKDRAFYLVSYIDEDDNLNELFWIDQTVFVKLRDAELIDDVE